MKKLIVTTAVLILGTLFAACGGAAGDSAKTFAEKKLDGNVTVTLSNSAGKLMNGEQDLVLQFTDGDGKPVEIKAAALNFNMPAMGSMAEMNDAATLTTTDTPGKFTGNVKLQMAGEWQAQISYEGTQNGNTTISTTAY